MKSSLTWAATASAVIAVNLTALVATAHAASPGLGSIRPYGGQRGTEIEVTLAGSRFSDAQELLLYDPGISVTGWTVESDTAVKAKLAIAADCRLGIHRMRVRTATGITNLRTFHVGALPEISETEPNSDFNAPQAIEPGVTINGVVESEDVDYFAIDLKKDQRITAEVEGIRLGTTFFDPYLAIMDQGRFELASSDDAALVWQDGVVSLVAPEDGRYVIQMRESAFGGSGACIYRLHVGHFPRPAALFPLGGKPGESLEARWLGDVSGERTQTFALPALEALAGPGSEHGLFPEDEQGIAPSANLVRVNALENTNESEPNNGVAEATPATVPGALNGIIAEAGDVDRYKFAATKGQVFDIHVYARRLRTPLDPVLNVLKADGGGLAGNDDSGGPDSYLRFTVPEDGEYLIQVRDHLGSGGPTFAYRVEVSPPAPVLTMGLPERSQFVDMTATVPKGNRAAFLVSGGRANFGGELNVEFAGMPAGVGVETVTMAGNQSIVPVLLTAPAEAATAGSLVDVIGKHADPNQKITGRLLQRTSLVRGRNNIRVWDQVTNRMAVAVGETAPYSIEIVQSKVPLVRNGRMSLKVVATRQEGFTAPIAVNMLYNPPGVGSQGSVQIPEGQNEATIALNANGNAELKTWKIAVIGQGDAGTGPVVVSTQLADLQVADMYFGFTFQAAAVEKGKSTDVVMTVAHNTGYEGAARVELLGLPNEVTAEPIELAAGSEEMVFKVNTTANSPAGKHKTLLCRAVVMQNGEPITHMIGSGELRIDEPLPPKADAPAPAPQAAATPEKPPERRLTRLEQLRLDREQAKAARAAQANAASETTTADADTTAGDTMD